METSLQPTVWAPSLCSLSILPSPQPGLCAYLTHHTLPRNRSHILFRAGRVAEDSPKPPEWKNVDGETEGQGTGLSKVTPRVADPGLQARSSYCPGLSPPSCVAQHPGLFHAQVCSPQAHWGQGRQQVPPARMVALPSADLQPSAPGRTLWPSCPRWCGLNFTAQQNSRAGQPGHPPWSRL